jgi:hypothetical protein
VPIVRWSCQRASIKQSKNVRFVFMSSLLPPCGIPARKFRSAYSHERIATWETPFERAREISVAFSQGQAEAPYESLRITQTDELPSGLPSGVFGAHFGVISTYHCPAFGIGVAALQALGPSDAPAQRAHLHAQTIEYKRTKKRYGEHGDRGHAHSIPAYVTRFLESLNWKPTPA